MNKRPEDSGQTDVSATRRSFIKKAVYTTPTLFVLGGLVKSNVAKADFGLPPSLCAPTDCAASAVANRRQRRK